MNKYLFQLFDIYRLCGLLASRGFINVYGSWNKQSLKTYRYEIKPRLMLLIFLRILIT